MAKSVSVYWPNLGYGRFGGKVTLDNSPWFDLPDQFDPKRLRLADIDGSGTTDVIYLGRDCITIYLNLAGNSLSDAEPLDLFPPVDNHAAVQTSRSRSLSRKLVLGGTKRLGTANHRFSVPTAARSHFPHFWLALAPLAVAHLALVSFVFLTGSKARTPLPNFFLCRAASI